MGSTNCSTTWINSTISDNILWTLHDVDGNPVGGTNFKKEGNMETLWEVILVTKDRDIYGMGQVVAEDEETARFEFAEAISIRLKRNDLKLKDVTILCIELGEVKVREEVKKVQVVDE